ncbi:Dual specificity protein phosphatase PHS1 [Heracleum sosnowskyi]|uniref:Dual specificity protein phosphatase PHS1 n=1 Tax=Heracleum sosnowskyi TaxID=360622 RepID=A0AAD8M5C6_9APIA|nr:Dual specificity protein phosphatase PHS1 [Heracleum sosnowskyi]
MSRDTDHHHKEDIYAFQKDEDDKESDVGSYDHEAPMPLTVTSRVLYMLGDITSGPGYTFTQWLELVRKRSSQYQNPGLSHYPRRTNSMPFLSAGEPSLDSADAFPTDEATEFSLLDRLGEAAMLDIESTSFSWNMLSSVHRTENSSSTEPSEDEMNKPLEVTVNSGGVLFFALFSQPKRDGSPSKEAVAVIKISSTRMATQSERLGYEFAKWLGVLTPQARVVHSLSHEWLQIKEAAERVRDAANADGDEIGEMTCSELLEALELSRCLFLMNYIHGSPLLESSIAFESREGAAKTAAALGRILLLDLVIRNEDRLPCQLLRWRGNFANLLLADNIASVYVKEMKEPFESVINKYRPTIIRALQKELRSNSVDVRLSPQKPGLVSQSSDLSDTMYFPKSSQAIPKSKNSAELAKLDLHIVAIDSGVPRRPPAGKRANDRAKYPKLVELLINSSRYASQVLYEVSGGKLGSPPENTDVVATSHLIDMSSVVHDFRSGFRAAVRDLQGFHIFLLTLHQKLDSLLKAFLNIIDKTSNTEVDKEDADAVASGSSAQPTGCVHFSSTPSKERAPLDNQSDLNESGVQKGTPKASSIGCKASSDSNSPMFREGGHGRFNKGHLESFRSMCLTSKLRDFHKFAKDDVELNKEIEQWNEMLKVEAVRLCQENNFSTGFFESGESSSVIDAYELKVRLEHILERIALISDAANTEKPSLISDTLFIGGALAARSQYTLQHLGITHILCLCSNEIGQSDSQYPDIFEYRNFSINDEEDANIDDLFAEARHFIDNVEHIGGKVLVHCFEGRSRSATVVLAYLMLKKNFTLLKAWNTLKRVHRRAQPNDGFAKILLDLDRKLHGKVSMEWQQRRPTMKVCPICGKNAGLSSSSLKLHLQKSHKKLSSGSVDSAMSMEIEKVMDALKISRGGSVSPKQQSHSMIE